MGRAMAEPENLFNNRLNLNRRLVLGAGAFLAASAGRSDRGFAMQKFESGRVMSDGLGIYTMRSTANPWPAARRWC